MTRPRIVQHSFGTVGSGGPIGALTRVLASDLGARFEFCHVAQPGAAGGLNLRLVIDMARQMRAFAPQLAHIRGLGNEGFHGVLAARLAGVPHILVSVHGSVRDLVHGPVGPRRWLVGRVLEPLTLRMATDVVTVCEAALDKPILRAVAHKVVGVVPNGVDPVVVPGSARVATRRDLGIGADDLVLIVVGRLVIDKGQLDLIAALDQLPGDRGQPNGRMLHVLVAGDGPDRALIEQHAARVTTARIHLLGRRSDVPALLAAADIAVLPSWHENMSNALLEAMAAGLPVITTRVDGNTEVVSRGGGLLVPPADPAALASAVADLCADPALRATLGREARAVIAANYTEKHMTDRLDRVYSGILGREPAPGSAPCTVLLGFTINDAQLDEIARHSSVLPTQTHNFAWNLVAALQAAGARVALLSVLPVPNCPEYPRIIIRSGRISSRGASGISLGFVNLLVLKHVTRFAACLHRGAAFVRRQAPKVVVVHGIHTPFLLFARLLRRQGQRICLVMTDPPGIVRDADGALARLLKRLDRRLVERLAAGFDGVIALTAALADDFAPHVPRLIVDGFVDEALRHGESAGPEHTDDTVTIAYAGGITREYGVANLVTAFRSLENPQLRLSLYGRGTLDDWVRSECAADVRITHHGVLARSDLLPQLRRARVLVNPRPADQAWVKYSFPSKLLEYLALGVPVVTTRLAGLGAEYSGLLHFTENDSVPALAAALQAVLADPDSARERAERARAYVVEHKSTRAAGARIAVFLAEIGETTRAGATHAN